MAVHAIIDDIYNIVTQIKESEASNTSIQPIENLKVIKGGDTNEGGYYDGALVISCIGWTPLSNGGIGATGYNTFNENVAIRIPVDYYILIQAYTPSATASIAAIEFLYTMFYVMMQAGNRPLSIKALEPQAAQPFGSNNWVASLRLRVLSSISISAEFYHDVVQQITQTYNIS